MKLQSLRSATLACAIGIALLPAAATAARSEFSPKDGLLLNAEHAAPAYHLRVIAPDGAVYEKVFNAGETINLRSEQLKAGWIDGAYRYELTPVRGTGIRAESQAGGAHAVAVQLFHDRQPRRRRIRVISHRGWPRLSADGYAGNTGVRRSTHGIAKCRCAECNLARRDPAGSGNGR